jgi:hypothetical protein
MRPLVLVAATVVLGNWTSCAGLLYSSRSQKAAVEHALRKRRESGEMAQLARVAPLASLRSRAASVKSGAPAVTRNVFVEQSDD